MKQPKGEAVRPVSASPSINIISINPIDIAATKHSSFDVMNCVDTGHLLSVRRSYKAAYTHTHTHTGRGKVVTLGGGMIALR